MAAGKPMVPALTGKDKQLSGGRNGALWQGIKNHHIIAIWQ